MKKLVIAVAASGALFATPALAGPVSGEDVVINASVAPECSMADVDTTVFDFDVDIVTSAGANALTIASDSAVKKTNTYTSCNLAATITISGLALENTAGAALAANDPLDFTNKLNYIVQLRSDDGSFANMDFNTAKEASDDITTAGAFHSNSEVNVRILNDADANPLRPVAGDYTATARIELSAV